MLTVARGQALLLLLLVVTRTWLWTIEVWCPCGLQQRECPAEGVLLLLVQEGPKAAAVAACGVGCLAAAAAA